jgi:CRP-like cAMP-binding protein
MAAPMARDAMRSSLSKVPLFAALSAADLDMLAAAARSVSFRKGARIFEEGAAADACYVLTQGRARVVLAGRDGAEILLNIVTPNQLVGEIALVDRSTRTASLIAAEACYLISLPAAAFDALRQRPAFETRLVAGLVHRLRQSDDRVRVISTFPSINRVAWCLTRIARAGGTRTGGGIVIDKPLHQELGEMAGCTRETVSRTLQTLRRRKLVTWDEKTMRLDIDGLQRFLTTELTAPDRTG